MSALVWVAAMLLAVCMEEPAVLLSPVKGAPIMVLLPDSPQLAQQAFQRWEPAVSSHGWSLLAPTTADMLAPADTALRALEATLEKVQARLAPDRQRIYLVGEGAGASAVFYFASRRPDLWAAAAAVGGNPRSAIETNRLFAANTLHVPVLWLPPEQDRLAESLRARLLQAGYNLAKPTRVPLSQAELLTWLAQHTRPTHPNRIDCETGDPAFGRCYWAQITELDFSRRNDVLGSSRVNPGSGAWLDLGRGFSVDAEAVGPGAVVSGLAQDYKGPLRVGDRIVAIAGKPIADGRAYLEFMETQREERGVGVIVDRGPQRLRLEARIRLPQRQELSTARVQAEYLPETAELLIVTRGVAALRLHIPASWAAARVNWNGLEAGTLTKGGCWQLRAGAAAIPCPQ